MIKPLKTISKYAVERRAVAIQWGFADGATIVSAAWSLSYPGDAALVIMDDADHPRTVVNGKTIAWLSGGTAGCVYRVMCLVTTSGKEDIAGELQIEVQ